MEIYTYTFKGCSLFCVNIFFNQCKGLCRFLNRMFIPQPPAYINWFRRVFKSIEIAFLPLEFRNQLISSSLSINIRRIL